MSNINPEVKLIDLKTDTVLTDENFVEYHVYGNNEAEIVSSDHKPVTVKSYFNTYRAKVHIVRKTIPSRLPEHYGGKNEYFETRYALTRQAEMFMDEVFELRARELQETISLLSEANSKISDDYSYEKNLSCFGRFLRWIKKIY